MENIFASDGLLAGCLPGYEPRTGQQQMALAVSSVLAKDISVLPDGRQAANLLLVEAETGIGKTLAYLVPAVLSGKRVVVSTATINLQDQIMEKELPLISKLLEREVKGLCVKGRQNYLCHYRWYQYLSTARQRLIDDLDCDRIEVWLKKTTNGDRAELSWLPDRSPLWAKISANSTQCLGSECPDASLCFVNQLRKKAGSASLLVVNHHLFFSDLVLRCAGYGEILPRYEAVIFDEAHHVEKVASLFFGRSVSQYQLLDLLGDIERQIEIELQPGEAEQLQRTVSGMKPRVHDFSAFFPAEQGRYALSEFVNDKPDWEERICDFSAGIERLSEQVGVFVDRSEGWKNLERRCLEINQNLREIALEQDAESDEGFVRWYERRERSLALSATPIMIGRQLQENLYSAVQSCVFTSATLTTGKDFSFVRERLGMNQDVDTLQLQSPFDYERRSLVYIPEDSFPEPAAPAYPDSLNERIFRLLQISRGRALVLFTSFKAMHRVASFLEPRLLWPILVQGTASRQALLDSFKTSTDSVLLAVASFWEGVDVQGDSLSCVIIDKLPFEVPSDPVLKARIDRVRKGGGNPFFDFQVPGAILTLRQGVGRLMRSAEDRGVIGIMDVRLYSKGYGRMFRAGLPGAPVVRGLEEIEEFFAKEGGK